MTERQIIYVVSDSVGETAELVTKAAISQFSGHNVNVLIKRFPFVEDKSNIHEVVMQAKMEHGMIAYTLVKPEVRNYMSELARQEGVYACDIIGPIIDQFQVLWGKRLYMNQGLSANLMKITLKKLKR